MRNEGFLALSLAFSLALVALGIGSGALEVARARKRSQGRAGEFLSPRRTMRRLFTSVVLVALGVMIFLGVHLLQFSPMGMEFLAYWGVIFLLVVWLFVCPFFDMSETQRVYRLSMKSLAEQTVGLLRRREESGPPEHNPKGPEGELRERVKE
ncbi:MAG: hypothetical protein QHH30_01030 [candidate division NC10 bacterium]|nr:hypothetical protein [candidate division NC10 bacterium]